jgi:antitoxin HicB
VTANTRKGRIGSSLDDYLKEEEIYEEVTARSRKRALARQADALKQPKDDEQDKKKE